MEDATPEFWEAEDDAVRCSLCYRNCLLAEGQTGPCGYRANEGGRLKLRSYGVISSSVLQARGYGPDPFLFYKPGQTAVFYGGIQCTAACTFCMSNQIVHKPEALEWGLDPKDQVPRPLGPGRRVSKWFGAKAIMTPETAVENARCLGVSSIIFGINEPTLSFEWTLEVARLAREEGLDVLVESNGFTAPEAIDRLAPFVNAVDIGVKGSADPEFYSRVMRSPGAVPAVLDALSRWGGHDVHVTVGDLVALPTQQDEAVFEDSARRFYDEVLSRLGPVTDLLVTGIKRPGFEPADIKPDPAFDDGGRVDRAVELAREAGLPFAHPKLKGVQEVRCPSCDGLLLEFRERCGAGLTRLGISRSECMMAQHFCPFWEHDDRNVTADSRCRSCSTDVPIVVMNGWERAQERKRMTQQWKPVIDGDGEVYYDPKWRAVGAVFGNAR